MENIREIIHEMNSVQLGNRKKTIRVFLPYDYYTTDKSYPVLYMMDGQNLMEPSVYSGYSWNVGPTVDSIQKSGVIDGIIIVGIDSDDLYRILEYSQSLSNGLLSYFQKEMGIDHVETEAIQFEDFVVHDVLPFIHHNYRTLPEQNGVAGSSCGGNISLYFAVDYPNVFKVVGAFSSAIHELGSDSLIPKLESFEIPADMKIYQDLGAKEGSDYLSSNRKVHKILLRKCKNKNQLLFQIQKDATHTELFWQDRFFTFIRWAYKSNQ